MFANLAIFFGKSLLTNELARWLLKKGLHAIEDWTEDHEKEFLEWLKRRWPKFATAQVQTALLADKAAVFSVLNEAINMMGGISLAQADEQATLAEVAALAAERQNVA